MSGLAIKDVYKTYPNGVEVLKGIDLEVDEGQFLILVGGSGCGKSTALRMIAGLETISSGELRIGGRVVNDLEPKDRDLAMVFQSYALYPHLTVRDNIAFALKLQKMPKEEIDRRVSDAARTLELTDNLERRPAQLSGGQRQRVAMGRAIVRQPQAFLMDEPLSNLDAKLRVAMRAEIKALHQRLKTTTVYVTHDQIEAMTMADRIVVMHDGAVEQIGTPLELYDRPDNLFVAQFIGSPSMNVIEGTVRRSNGRCAVEAHGAMWPVPAGAAVGDGKAVHYGVRPGDMTLSDPANGVPAKVIVVEPTGAETELLVEVGEAKITLAIHGRVDAQPDQMVGLVIASESVHMFDRESGKRLA